MLACAPLLMSITLSTLPPAAGVATQHFLHFLPPSNESDVSHFHPDILSFSPELHPQVPQHVYVSLTAPNSSRTSRRICCTILCPEGEVCLLTGKLEICPILTSTTSGVITSCIKTGVPPLCFYCNDEGSYRAGLAGLV